jgi:hypothetical protein
LGRPAKQCSKLWALAPAATFLSSEQSFACSFLSYTRNGFCVFLWEFPVLIRIKMRLTTKVGIKHCEVIIKISLHFTSDADPKSTSIERTFSPKRDLSELQQIVGNLCEKLINSLPKHGIIGGRSATLKVNPNHSLAFL